MMMTCNLANGHSLWGIDWGAWRADMANVRKPFGWVWIRVTRTSVGAFG